MAFGLSSAGFSKKRLSDIKAEIEESLRATFGNFINLFPSSILSQFVGIVAEREASLWELAEAVYNSQYPDSATGVPLDNVAAITGTTRREATKSTLSGQRLFGTAGSPIPAGTVFSVQGNPLARFVTDEEVTLVAGVDEVQTLSFSATPTSGSFKLSWNGEETAAIPYDANAAAVQAALLAISQLAGLTVAGSFAAGFTITFGGDAGKQEQPLLVVLENSLDDGAAVSATVAETTAGENQGEVDLTAESTGPTSAPAYTLTVIETPVAGLESVLNPLDATVGRATETDAALRIRREEELQKAGAGTVEAIRVALLQVSGVTDVVVFENDTDAVDGDGRPPKSVHAFVEGGEDQDIWDKLWTAKAGGISTHGDEAGTVTDSMGIDHTMRFDRPTELEIYLEVDLTTDSSFPSDGLVQTEDALKAFGDELGLGDDVIVYPKLVAALDEIPGILDVAIRIGTAPGPTLDNNISVGVSERAKFDTSRITVVEL